jgi:hypothetical protein
MKKRQAKKILKDTARYHPHQIEKAKTVERRRSHAPQNTKP